MAAKSEYFTKAGDWLEEFNNYCNEAHAGDIVVASVVNAQYIFEVADVRYGRAKDKDGKEMKDVITQEVIPVGGSICKVEKIRIDDEADMDVFPRFTTKYTPVAAISEPIYLAQVTCLKTKIPSVNIKWLDDSDVKNRIDRYRQILQQYNEAVGV